jgi:hypothetical protein
MVEGETIPRPYEIDRPGGKKVSNFIDPRRKK